MNTNGRILILTCEDDPHADHLVLKLKDRGIRPFRFHTADFPLKATINIGLGSKEVVEFKCDAENISSEEIKSVWYRRPEKSKLDESLTPAERDTAEKECTATLQGAYRLLTNALWVNHPDYNRVASSKMLQLKHAQFRALRVPDTLLTNDPKEFIDFYHKHSGNVVVKTQKVPFLSIEEGQAFYTSKISEDLLQHADLIRNAPCLFQEYIPKAVELRITVIGNEIFTAALYSQQTETGTVDWRKSQPGTLRHEKYNLSIAVQRELFYLVTHYNLKFATIDMIVTPKGEYVFLEINPNGQFGWIETQLGFPLYDTLADLLIGR